jgi:SNF2 family DNA or RNA helicase
MVEVSQRLAPLFVRTNKSELDLDEPDRNVELVTMGPLQAEIYEALRTKLRHANVRPRERAQWGRMGEVVMYLLEAASNPALLAKAVSGTDAAVGPVWPLLDIPPSSGLAEKVLGYRGFEPPAKFTKLATMVAANAEAGQKTLVWSNFVDTLEELALGFLAPYNPAVIHGSVPTTADAGIASRDGELRRFRQDSGCAVLLANPAAMSEGVSLHRECHDAIYVDRTFNAGQYLQSVDRIHRLGLQRGTETRIRFLVCRGTVDEVVDDRVRVKAERLAQMLSDPSLVTMALPDEEDYGEWVEPDDLTVLLRHLGSHA